MTKHTQTFKEFKKSLRTQKVDINSCEDFVPEMIYNTVKAIKRELRDSNITKSESRILISQIKKSKEKFQNKCK